jgi:hypothetical protein
MENMPEDRVKAVITGRQVQARGADLDRLRQVIARAADLSAGLADARHRAAGTGPQPRRHQTEWHDREAQVPGVAERLLNHGQAVDRDITGIRSPPQAARNVPPSR